MSNEFKIGDLIKVLNNDRGSGSNGVFFRAGDVGRITIVDLDGDLWVDFDVPENPGVPTVLVGDAIWCVNPSVAELVDPALTDYTVILLRPDYATSNFGQDTYMISVRAKDPTGALAKGRAEVLEGDGNEHCDPTDYFCIALIAGQHEDLNPEA